MYAGRWNHMELRVNARCKIYGPAQPIMTTCKCRSSWLSEAKRGNLATYFFKIWQHKLINNQWLLHFSLQIHNSGFIIRERSNRCELNEHHNRELQEKWTLFWFSFTVMFSLGDMSSGWLLGKQVYTATHMHKPWKPMFFFCVFDCRVSKLCH